MSREQVMIHVRFAADGSVTEIGARPQTLSAQQWFNHLSRNVPGAFESLSGGRGLFRLSPDQTLSLKQSAAH